jgi:hypothetical protein
MPLSGNYAVRFNMNLVEGEYNIMTAQHEGAVFGINHTGSSSNWWYAGGTNYGGTYSSDGVWYFVTSQFGGNLSGDYQEFTGLGGTNGNTGWTRPATDVAPNYVGIYKANPSPYQHPAPPFNAPTGPFSSLDDALAQSGGVPANAAPALGYDASTWSDVEIKQINHVVTMSINRTAIFSYTNTSVWQSGYLMLGYADPYGTVQTLDSSVYYANLTVVQFATPAITKFAHGGGNVTITFTGGAGDDVTSFALTSSATLSHGTFADVSPPATITALGGNVFQAVTPQSAAAQQFYRIRRN